MRDVRVRLLVLVTATFVLLVGAADPLRPLVMRTDQPRGVAPSECDEGLSPTPALRVDVRQIPLPEAAPAAAVAPPSRDLRAALEDVQNALVRNDRPAFDAALARVRGIVESYPSGGERRAAEETLRIYEGAGRLWESQYQAPFFAQDSPEYTIVNAYPGYAEAVRRSTLTDQAGRRFYPAAESREFLARVASERLKRLGVRAPAPPARTASTRTAPPQRRAATTSSPSRSRPRVSTSRKARKPAATKSAPSTPSPSASPTVAAVPAPAAPQQTAPPAAGDSSDTAPPPAVADTPAVAATDTVATTPAPATAPVTTTTAAAPVTTTTVDAPAEPAPRSRSIILPTILILIGLGVLIVLFRAAK